MIFFGQLVTSAHPDMYSMKWLADYALQKLSSARTHDVIEQLSSSHKRFEIEEKSMSAVI
jgi:hypothetical protein